MFLRSLRYFVLTQISLLHDVKIFQRAKNFASKFQKNFGYENFFYDKLDPQIQRVLPLSIEERSHFTDYSNLAQTIFKLKPSFNQATVQLVSSEKLGMKKDYCRFMIYFAQSAVYMIVDEFLYRAILYTSGKRVSLTRRNKRNPHHQNRSNKTLLDSLNSFYRKKEKGMGETFSLKSCYPKAHPPDYRKNKQISNIYMRYMNLFKPELKI